VDNAWDYFMGKAYVGYSLSNHLWINFGFGNHFYGNGYRSLLLGDFVSPYLYLQLNANVWKLQYQTLLAQQNSQGFTSHDTNGLVPKKYLAAHYLSYKTKRMEIGLFESVAFGRKDHFEFQYLNPVIFYRSIEHFQGSADNVLLGLNMRYTIPKVCAVYGQLALDEFVLKELLSNKGWWGNKYGLQIGALFVDIAKIDHLDARIEYNRIRPYTYEHYDTVSSYTHYLYPLSHPAGANLQELIFELQYKPIKKLSISTSYIHLSQGLSTANYNAGEDPLHSFTDVINSYGNYIGQGILSKTNIFKIKADYALFHNFNCRLEYQRRTQNPTYDGINSTNNYVAAGIILNFFPKAFDF